MKPSDLREGATYRGKSGPERKIVKLLGSEVVYERDNGGLDEAKPLTRKPFCKRATFAAWAIEEVRDA